MLRNQYRRGVCSDCGTECVLRRRVPRHEVHLALTIATMGIWGVCWIITVIAARWESWRCTDCQRAQRGGPETEETRERASAEAAIGSSFGLMHKHLD